LEFESEPESLCESIEETDSMFCPSRKRFIISTLINNSLSFFFSTCWKILFIHQTFSHIFTFDFEKNQKYESIKTFPKSPVEQLKGYPKEQFNKLLKYEKKN